MKYINHICICLVIFSFFSCKATPQTTPEILGQEILEAIRKNDVSLFRKHIVNDEDKKWILTELKENRSEAQGSIEYRISGWKIYDKKVVNTLHQEGIDKGVNWDDIKFEKVEYKIINQDIPKSDIYILFSSKNISYKIKMDDCLQVKRGWIIFDDVTFD